MPHHQIDGVLVEDAGHHLEQDQLTAEGEAEKTAGGGEAETRFPNGHCGLVESTKTNLRNPT